MPGTRRAARSRLRRDVPHLVQRGRRPTGRRPSPASAPAGATARTSTARRRRAPGGRRRRRSPSPGSSRGSGPAARGRGRGARSAARRWRGSAPGGRPRGGPAARRRVRSRRRPGSARFSAVQPRLDLRGPPLGDVDPGPSRQHGRRRLRPAPERGVDASGDAQHEVRWWLRRRRCPAAPTDATGCT